MSDFTPRLGWVDFNDRTEETNVAHEKAVGDMPAFKIYGAQKTSLKKVVLTDLWSHPLVQQALGYKFPRIHQLTGSCVGAGGGNAVFTTISFEVVRLGDPEQIFVPLWLLNYGKSRQRAGFRGRGEGSIGSAFAESLRLDGVTMATLDGLPKFSNADGLVWSESVEMQWSDGASIPSQYLTDAKKHLIKTTAQCRNSDAVRDAILNGYPCTDACSGFVNRATVKGVGDEAVCFGDIDTNGGHQTSIQGWWEHPSFGELFLYQNNWPAQVYPKDPAGGAPCSVWISKKRMDWICRQGEVYAISQYDGFPAQKLDESLFMMV